MVKDLCKSIAVSKRNNILTIAVISMAFIAIMFHADQAFAYSNPDDNADAKWLLNEYYDPEDCLDTGMYNIQNGYTKKEYTDQDQLDNIYQTTDEITADCTTGREAFQAIHDWICLNIIYDSTQTDNDGNVYNGYPYHALANPFAVYKNKKAVCYGFANLTQLMCQRAGVPCVVVRGNSNTHVWNAVYVDDQWYFTDNTWDENYTAQLGSLNYTHYLMSDSFYDTKYATAFIEAWNGDACYFPVSVDHRYPYHTITIDPKDNGTCRKTRIPFNERDKKLLLPPCQREGRTFRGYKTDSLNGATGFGGWYVQQDTPIAITEDITVTALYNKLTPEGKDVLELDCHVRVGKTLSEVPLPEGYTWLNPNAVIATTGYNFYYGRHTPEDTDEYTTVTAKIYFCSYDSPLIKSVKTYFCKGADISKSDFLKAEDGVDGDITDSVTIEPSTIDSSSTGTTTITATVTNSHGLTTTRTLNIIVRNHNLVSPSITNPTCTEPGITTGHCSYCDKDITEETAALGHKWKTSTTVDKPVTCTEDGQESIHCQRCNAIQEGSITVIPKTGHSFGKWITTRAATCTETGLQERTCSECQFVETQEIEMAHSWKSMYTTDKAATCEENGQKSVHCRYCGLIKEGSIVILPALGHSWESTYTIDKEATCQETGLKSKHCSRCNQIQEGSVETIPKTDHNYGSWIETKEASCTEAGSKYRTCSTCQHEETAAIEALGHSWESTYTIDKEATCQETGLKSKHCSRCNQIQEGTTVTIPLASHSMGDWIVDQEASCNESGSKHRVCSVCDFREDDTISATGAHQYGDWTIDTDATYDDAGSKHRTCSVCQYQEVAEIPALTRTNINKAALANISNTVYTGKAITPAISVTYNGKALSADNYTVSYSNNVNIGTATVTITGKNAFNGTLSKSFSITPGKVTIKKVTPAKKALTVKARKLGGGVGYQYAVKLKGTSKWKTYKSSSASKKIKRLKSKKKYYVRVRAYKKVGGKTYYGAYSTVKTVKTK